MITGERGIKKVNIPLNLWLVAITRKHKHTSNATKIDATISKNRKEKEAFSLQYPKITRKNKHNQDPAQLNQHNEDRRYNIPLNLLLVATGCKEHCGRLGALSVARCIVGAWVFRDKKVAHVLQRHACRWVETCRTHSTVYPYIVDMDCIVLQLSVVQ